MPEYGGKLWQLQGHEQAHDLPTKQRMPQGLSLGAVPKVWRKKNPQGILQGCAAFWQDQSFLHKVPDANGRLPCSCHAEALGDAGRKPSE